MVAGLQELQTLFGTYDEFVSRFCNVVFLICNVGKSLCNGTLIEWSLRFPIKGDHWCHT